MTIPDAVSGSAALGPGRPPRWLRVLLSAVMILGGVAVLADVAFASIVSSAFIGAAAIVVGTFEIVHAIWTRGWGGLLWQMLLGLLYVAVGLVLVGLAGSSVMVLTYVLVRSSGQGELLLTYGLGLLLALSGLVRILLGLGRRHQAGWMMLLSGAFGVAAGLVVLSDFPKMGLWIFGLLLGIDLIVHGTAWLSYATLPRSGRS